MSKMANLGAGILGGFIAGRQAKDRKTREAKQDEVYEKILGKMMGAQETEKNSTTTPTVNPLVPANATPVTASTNTDPMKKDVGMPTLDEDGNPMPMRNGGMVMPRSDRMSWQRQSFKK